jgi:hypothetical protein
MFVEQSGLDGPFAFESTAALVIGQMAYQIRFVTIGTALSSVYNVCLILL